jgi:hypothetical protein
VIELNSVTRENFDDSGLSNGYAIGAQMSDIETEILRLIKGAFAGIQDVPMRTLPKEQTRTRLFEHTVGIQASAIALFQNARTELFDNLNRSIENGFRVGKASGARQTGSKPPPIALTDSARGKETVRLANGNLLKAMGLAVQGAINGATAAITLLTSGMLADTDMTFRQAYDRFVVPQFEKGLPGKTTVDGKQISLVGYAETIARESSQQALLIGESATAKDAGYSLVQISAHYACCPLCEPWQNAILVDDVWADGKPDGVHRLMSEALLAGLFHYNCRHVKRIYIPGKTVANNPPNYDPEKVAVNYELEQTQRRLERDIRNEKRKLIMSLTDDERAKAESKIAERQAQLRGLVKFADDNGYKVYRQNWKEQITFEKKPTRPYEPPEDMAETLTKSGESGTIEIQRNPATGRASAIRLMGADLNKRQQKVLERLHKAGDSLESTKSQIKTKDIAALTAKEGVEFALFSKGNRRLIVRGDSFGTPVGEARLRQLAADGWKFSAHSHPTIGKNSLLASSGDMKVLYLFKQGQSVIYNASGEYGQFFKE